MVLSQVTASLWASENEKVEPCHFSDPSLEAVVSRSWWDIWLRKGVPAQQLPTLPAQCTNQQNTWPGLATVGPRSPALPQPPQHKLVLFRSDVWEEGGEILGRDMQHTHTRAHAHPHTSPFQQTEKAVTCKQVQRTCQESPGIAFQ